ncbi:MAG: tetratricopeptide repeat protein [Pseudomonadota bacterium]
MNRYVIRAAGGAFSALALTLFSGCATTGDAATPEPVAEPIPEGFETRAGAASYHLLRAELALQKNRYDVAVDEYVAAARYSDDDDVAERATEVAFDAGRDDAARVAVKRWRALDPGSTQALQYQLRLALREGDTDTAQSAAREWLARLDSEREERFLGLSTLLLQENTPAASLAVAREIARENDGASRAHYAHGLVALRTGDTAAARDAALRASELAPDWAHASLLYARALIAGGDIEDGINYAAERIGGNNAISERLEYGSLLAGVGREDEAQIVLEQVLRDDRSNPGALRALGLLYLKLGDLDGAQAMFTQLLATGRNAYDAMYYLASIAESQNQMRRAVRLYSQVIEGPNAAPSQLRVAGILSLEGKTDEALQHLENFAAAQPRYTVDMALGQGEILIADDQTDRALTLYDDVLAAYPNEVRVEYARAFLLEDLDRVDDALHQLRLVLARDPNDPDALNALGYTLADRTDQVDEAYELIERAYQLNSDSPAIIDSLGWVQFKRGNLNEAQSLLEQAYARFPDIEIAAHLIEVLYHQGDQKGAARLLTNALLRAPDNDKLLDVKTRLGL